MDTMHPFTLIVAFSVRFFRLDTVVFLRVNAFCLLHETFLRRFAETKPTLATLKGFHVHFMKKAERFQGISQL